MITSKNSDVAVQTGLSNITETILKRRHMLSGHVARLDATTPAHQILKKVITVKSGYQPDAVWRRAPGRPRNSWIMQIGNGTPLSIRQEWKKAQDHGNHGESSQRTSAVDASCSHTIYESDLRIYETRLSTTLRVMITV